MYRTSISLSDRVILKFLARGKDFKPHWTSPYWVFQKKDKAPLFRILSVIRAVSYSMANANTRLPSWLKGKESACQAGDRGLIPELGRCPGEGNGNLLQYSCLDNLMNRGTWWVTVHGVAKESGTIEQLNNHSNNVNTTNECISAMNGGRLCVKRKGSELPLESAAIKAPRLAHHASSLPPTTKPDAPGLHPHHCGKWDPTPAAVPGEEHQCWWQGAPERMPRSSSGAGALHTGGDHTGDQSALGTCSFRHTPGDPAQLLLALCPEFLFLFLLTFYVHNHVICKQKYFYFFLSNTNAFYFFFLLNSTG